MKPIHVHACLTENLSKMGLNIGGASIMIFKCFSYYGVSPIYCIPGIMDHLAYIKILEEVMLPYAEKEMPLKWVFQRDNDPNHTSKRNTVEVLLEVEVKDPVDWGFCQVFPVHLNVSRGCAVQLPPLPPDPTHHQVVIS
uniref:Tc1-like transposase DDE domain-containing protein n=1 Tax=Amphilophus citrinellus TaxID=61819 RepID=A0A3Q0RUE3_AMPCI